ncbi:unnamed protein product, partial [Staurois parvus]
RHRAPQAERRAPTPRRSDRSRALRRSGARGAGTPRRSDKVSRALRRSGGRRTPRRSDRSLGPQAKRRAPSHQARQWAPSQLAMTAGTGSVPWMNSGASGHPGIRSFLELDSVGMPGVIWQGSAEPWPVTP